MSVNNDEIPVTIQTSGSDSINLTDKERFEEMFKKLFENQQKLLEELRLSRMEQNGKKRGLEDVDDSTENPAKRIDSTILSENAASLTASEMQNPIFEKTGKWFVLNHTFKNVSELGEGIRVYSEEQEHFGIIWRMYIRRNKEHLAFFQECKNDGATRLWSIETDLEVKTMLKNGKSSVRMSSDTYKPKTIDSIKGWEVWGWKTFNKWEDFKNEFLIDDNWTFECSFKIKNMTGIYKDNLRNFDDPECSDIVLIVKDKKFYVAKLFLATHSPYFKAMFLGMFSDSMKSEIPLTGIDADDFQNYLEVLYGDSAIDEYTVEGLLMVADMYDTQIVIQKCEEFLLKDSKKTMKKKLEMAVRYRLEKLKEKCLSEIKTLTDIRAVLPSNSRDMDPSLLADLLDKSLAISSKYSQFFT